MIIGISGKKQAGKDTVGEIIQYLIYNEERKDRVGFYYPVDVWLEERNEGKLKQYPLKANNHFEVKKFADKLKQMASLMLGIPVEDFEKEEVKNRVLGEEWTSYGTAKGFWSHSDGNPLHKMMDSVPCDKETYEAELRINWQTAYKRETTVRLFLQLLGTEAIRNQIHVNAWVNALMCDYKTKSALKGIEFTCKDGSKEFIDSQFDMPNWIITDVRFPNELAVVDGKGFSIRVNRFNSDGSFYGWGNPNSDHISETALDDAKFDYTIENNGTIEELIVKVKEILIKEKII